MTKDESPQRPILLTIGDPNGIGPEIAVKAAIELADSPQLRPVVVGDAEVIGHWAERLGCLLNAREEDWGKPGIDIHPVPGLSPDGYSPGRVCAEAGAATVAFLKDALALARAGKARAIVSCPHSETAINASGRAFSGYPGLIAELTGTPKDRVFLMLVGGGYRIVHATLHESTASALARLTPELIESAALAGVAALEGLGIPSPRIGLFGINPHAGEGGLFGQEDITVTTVAAERLRARGLDVSGPEGADLMLQKGGPDLYVAMLHDQGHIPIKLLAGRTASALSVGAGVPFSSVGHGAAFNIAGNGTAEPDAVIRTIRLLGGSK